MTNFAADVLIFYLLFLTCLSTLQAFVVWFAKSHTSELMMASLGERVLSYNFTECLTYTLELSSVRYILQRTQVITSEDRSFPYHLRAATGNLKPVSYLRYTFFIGHIVSLYKYECCY